MIKSFAITEHQRIVHLLQAIAIIYYFVFLVLLVYLQLSILLFSLQPNKATGIIMSKNYQLYNIVVHSKKIVINSHL